MRAVLHAVIGLAGCGRVAFDASGVNRDAATDTKDSAAGCVIDAAMDQAPAGWQLNGSARMDASTSSVRLAALPNEAGTIVYATRLPVANIRIAFDFQFAIGDGDGMAVMFTPDGATALGDAGGNLGIGGLNGFGVELDSHFNKSDMCFDDIDGNHVGIDTLPYCSAPFTAPTPLVQTTISTFTLTDAIWHRAEIQIEDDEIAVSLDGTAFIEGFPRPDPDPAPLYVGFAGANGSAVTQYYLRDVRIETPGACP